MSHCTSKDSLWHLWPHISTCPSRRCLHWLHTWIKWLLGSQAFNVNLWDPGRLLWHSSCIHYTCRVGIRWMQLRFTVCIIQVSKHASHEGSLEPSLECLGNTVLEWKRDVLEAVQGHEWYGPESCVQGFHLHYISVSEITVQSSPTVLIKKHLAPS